MDYYYYIDSDERGEFSASVRDSLDSVVFNINGFDIFEDGFMRDKLDLIGLEKYLIDLVVIGFFDKIVLGE